MQKWYKIIETKEDLEEYFTELIESNKMLNDKLNSFDSIRYFTYNNKTYSLYSSEYDYSYTYDDICELLYNIIKKQSNCSEYMYMILKSLDIPIYKTSDFKKTAKCFGENKPTGKLADFKVDNFACIDTDLDSNDIVENIGLKLLKDYCNSKYLTNSNWVKELYWSDTAIIFKLPEQLYKYYNS